VLVAAAAVVTYAIEKPLASIKQYICVPTLWFVFSINSTTPICFMFGGFCNAGGRVANLLMRLTSEHAAMQ
jgi:hypothetical protein